MNDQDFKVVSIDVPNCSQLNGRISRIFGEMFNGQCDMSDIRVSLKDHLLKIHLKELDMMDFDESVARFKRLADERFDSDRSSLFCQLGDLVHSTVNGIGSYGFRNQKRVFVGYNRERKTLNRKEKVLRRGKHFYAKDHDFGRRDNTIPASFANRIKRGDSEAILRNLPDNCIDLVFTSPPYNFGLDYGGDNDSIDWESYFEKIYRILDQCIRVLCYGGRLVINVQPLFSDYIPSHHLISSHLMSRRMIWKGEILWEKNNYNCKYTAWGSWKSPSSPYLKYTWEFVEVFCKGDLKKSGSGNDADIPADCFKKWVNAKWSIAPERNMKDYGHPAMFPEELARRILLLFSFRGDAILDPFAGVGTTCVAAKQTGRIYTGIDISDEYCKTSRRRLKNTIFQPLLF